MKKIVCVCLFASGSKKHYIIIRMLLVIDGQNLVEPWVTEVREYESGYKFEVKGQKSKEHRFGYFEVLKY